MPLVPQMSFWFRTKTMMYLYINICITDKNLHAFRLFFLLLWRDSSTLNFTRFGANRFGFDTVHFDWLRGGGTHGLQVLHAHRKLPQGEQDVETPAQVGDVAHLEWHMLEKVRMTCTHRDKHKHTHAHTRTHTCNACLHTHKYRLKQTRVWEGDTHYLCLNLFSDTQTHRYLYACTYTHTHPYTHLH